MLLRSNTLLLHNGNNNMILRSGRELTGGRNPSKASKNKTTTGATKNSTDGVDAVPVQTPDCVPSSNPYECDTDDQGTPPHILRLAWREPVDAAEWDQLSREEREKYAGEGRAPIKTEES